MSKQRYWRYNIVGCSKLKNLVRRGVVQIKNTILDNECFSRKMMTNALLLGLLNLAAHLALSSGVWPFTKNDEIPNTVVKTAKSYELRTYPEGMWVCKNYTGLYFGVRQVSNSFFALYDYASGANLGGISMEIKVPVTARIVLNVNAQRENLYQMCYYLPREYQNDPPIPSAEGVFVKYVKGLTIAARKFNAFLSTTESFETQTKLLIADLRANNEENMDFSQFYGAVYDPPFTINARFNEVWIAKKD